MSQLLETTATNLRWIPVSEQLPAESGVFVVCASPSKGWQGQAISTAYWLLVNEEGQRAWSLDFNGAPVGVEMTVTHWMSLPAPPPQLENN